jgi:hypothetical protein
MKNDALEQVKKDTEKWRRKASEKEDLRKQIKINKDFDKLLKREKREATKRWKREIKSTADQFRKRRKQIEIDARKATREAKTWEREIRKEERERRKEASDWRAEAQKWKKESQRLKRNEKAREKRAEQNRRIAEGKWKGKKKFGQLQLKLEDKLKKIWNKPKENLKPILTKHGIKRKVKKYVINPKGVYDPAYFLTITKDEVTTLINSETEAINVSMSLACEMVRNDPKTGEEVSTVAQFRSKTHKLVGTDDTEEVYDIMKEKMLKSFSEYQKRGSGWRLRRVDLLEIHIGEFQPLRGKGHEPLPESIVRRRRSSI